MQLQLYIALVAYTVIVCVHMYTFLGSNTFTVQNFTRRTYNVNGRSIQTTNSCGGSKNQ